MIVGIIQARLGSTRMPNKVFLPLPSGETMVEYIYNQVAESVVDMAGVATPDRLLFGYLKENNIPCVLHEGARDVLFEYYKAASVWNADHIVRITADCPLVTPEIINEAVHAYLDDDNCDYLYNHNDVLGGFGDGMDVEVFSFNALETAYQDAVKAEDREHVTRYLYTSGRFNIKYISPPQIEGCSVNTESDYDKVYEILRKQNDSARFGKRDILG
jgi:spore coat polysaccharide biosynthesis protein SpsF (cytidylyltransferase family)